jgi:hypothetical protein
VEVSGSFAEVRGLAEVLAEVGRRAKKKLAEISGWVISGLARVKNSGLKVCKLIKNLRISV